MFEKEKAEPVNISARFSLSPLIPSAYHRPMAAFFSLAPIPTLSPLMPTPTKELPTSSLATQSSSPSQTSFKSYSPLLNPANATNRRPIHRFVFGCVKVTLWGLALVIVVIVFLSRPPLFPSSPRPRKVATFESNLTLSQYIDVHFPVGLAPAETPHLWITLADEGFAATGAANHDLFFKQLNLERRAHYGALGIPVRDSVIVTLCMDEACARECVARDMYCYEGFEKTRPPQVSRAELNDSET